MKLNKFIFGALLCLILTVPTAAKKKTIESDIYRRNSLCTYFISDIDLLVSESGVREEIKSFLDGYVVSDKYDDHTIDDRYVSVKNIEFTDEDRDKVDPEFAKKRKKKQSKFGKFLQEAMESNATYVQTKAQNDAMIAESERNQFASSHPEIFTASSDEELEENTYKTAAKIYKYLTDNKFANKLIAKWFNAKEQVIDGSHYDLSLIQERGLYNASELDVLRAKESTRKWAVLKDAGMELIPNTFVSFTQFEIIDGRKYTERLHKSPAGQRASKFVGGLFGESKYEMEERHMDSESQLAGYYITATTYLFKLEWTNDDLEKFINEYWESDLSKLENSEDFKLKYLGFERIKTKTTQDVKGKGKKLIGNIFKEAFDNTIEQVFEGKSESQIRAENRAENESARIEMTLEMTEQALIRSIDATYAALQKSHEEFKVKAPLIDVSKNAITAFIGLKEGINSKSEFEVLERSYNKKKQKYEYKKVGKLKVDKKRIWDNRYTLIDEGTNVVGKGKKATTIDRTYLKGSTGSLAPGMLLHQIK